MSCDKWSIDRANVHGKHVLATLAYASGQSDTRYTDDIDSRAVIKMNILGRQQRDCCVLCLFGISRSPCGFAVIPTGQTSLPPASGHTHALHSRSAVCV